MDFFDNLEQIQMYVIDVIFNNYTQNYWKLFLHIFINSIEKKKERYVRGHIFLENESIIYSNWKSYGAQHFIFWFDLLLN